MTKIDKWTVVQHSGFGYAQKPGFEKAVEVRNLTTVGEMRKVEKAGGVVFDNYREADDFCDSENFPEGVPGVPLYPSVRGTFSFTEIDGLRIYVPRKADNA